MEILKGRMSAPWFCVLYGVPGIGKSTLASAAPAPLFLDLEGGLTRIDCDRSPRITTWAELIDALRFAHGSDYRTIVLDTVDGLEDIIRRHVCDANSWKSIEAPGYGKGYAVMQEKFLELLAIADKLKEKGKNVIMVGHEVIKTHTAPDQDAYDRYILKMNQKLSSVLVGRADAVFFCQYEAIVKDDKTKDERVRAVGTGRRIMRTQEAPAWIAKNRFGLESTVAMDASVFEKLV